VSSVHVEAVAIMEFGNVSTHISFLLSLCLLCMGIANSFKPACTFPRSVGYFVGWPSFGGTVKLKPQRGFHWRLQSNSRLETPGPRSAYSGVLQLVVT
jgi:hypothetical protein